MNLDIEYFSMQALVTNGRTHPLPLLRLNWGRHAKKTSPHFSILPFTGTVKVNGRGASYTNVRAKEPFHKLFWDTDGNTIGNGIQIAYVLGIPAGGPSTTARTRQAELRRRRLWACVCMMMFGSKADFIVGNIPSILERIPLPGVYEHQVARALSEPEPYNADSHLCAIYAALIHILSLW